MVTRRKPSGFGGMDAHPVAFGLTADVAADTLPVADASGERVLLAYQESGGPRKRYAIVIEPPIGGRAL